MRIKIENDEDRCIQILRWKSKISEYRSQITKSGLFNPICPLGYNFLTGYVEYDVNKQMYGVSQFSFVEMTVPMLIDLDQEEFIEINT